MKIYGAILALVAFGPDGVAAFTGTGTASKPVTTELSSSYMYDMDRRSGYGYGSRYGNGYDDGYYNDRYNGDYGYSSYGRRYNDGYGSNGYGRRYNDGYGYGSSPFRSNYNSYGYGGYGGTRLYNTAVNDMVRTAGPGSTSFGMRMDRLGGIVNRQGTAMSVPLALPNSNGAKEIFETGTEIKVQGGSLKTWSFMDPYVERVQVVMKTDGRPLDADVELWQGPDNTPTKMRVYCEDGNLRPFSALLETPKDQNSVSIRNIGQLEFPLDACVEVEGILRPSDITQMGASMPRTIQGGALKTYPFDPMVESVAVLLETDGRPLNAKIELLQGPNNTKQVVDVYTEDGLDRPFYIVLETPGSGNVVRIVNSATVEFPMTAWVEPYRVGARDLDRGGVIIN